MAQRKTNPPVSEHTLMVRVWRVLVPLGLALKASRSRVQIKTMGKYFIVDVNRQSVVQGQINDLAAYARKLGALRPWEHLQRERDRATGAAASASKQEDQLGLGELYREMLELERELKRADRSRHAEERRPSTRKQRRAAAFAARTAESHAKS